MTANALKDWCRFAGTASSYIDPGSPWQNPYVESFGSRVQHEPPAASLRSPYGLTPRDGATPTLQQTNTHRLSQQVDP